MSNARRLVWLDVGRVAIEEFEPAPPGEGQVQLATVCTLLSPGTERAWFLGLPNTPATYPSRPGYNHVGRITALGPGVVSLAVGDLVASAGGHGSVVNVAVNRALRIPEGVAPEAAVFWNMGAIALQGARRARIELGEAVATIGLGLVGQLALQLSRLDGALPAIGIDVSSSRRLLAARCGADAVLDPREEGYRERLAALCAADGPGIVIEATGSPQPVQHSLEIAGTGGRVVLLGSTRGVSDGVNWYQDIHKRGLQVFGAHGGARPGQDRSPGHWTLAQDGDAVLRLIAAGRLQVEPLITDRVPWHEATGVYERLKAWDDALLGVVLDWQGSAP